MSARQQEPFYVASLDINHKKDVAGALQGFVQGEMFAGGNAVFCPTCNKKVCRRFLACLLITTVQTDTMSRLLFDQLPPTLVLHLKRFEMDYNTMEYKKLNGEISFPEVNSFKIAPPPNVTLCAVSRLWTCIRTRARQPTPSASRRSRQRSRLRPTANHSRYPDTRSE